MENLLIACCGLNCTECEARKATIANDNELRQTVAKKWCEWNHTDAITPESINCMGCRTDGVKFVYCSHMCEIRKCANKKHLPTCAECTDKVTCSRLNAIISNNEIAKKNVLG